MVWKSSANYDINLQFNRIRSMWQSQRVRRSICLLHLGDNIITQIEKKWYTLEAHCSEKGKKTATVITFQSYEKKSPKYKHVTFGEVDVFSVRQLLLLMKWNENKYGIIKYILLPMISFDLKLELKIN